MEISCIYKIASKAKPDKVYIGSAVDFCKRKTLHISLLKNCIHTNKIIQNHVKKYGIDDISFEITERVFNKELLIQREQFYIDLYKPVFNICRIAGSRLGVKGTGRIFTEQHRKNLSKAKIGKKCSEEARLNMSKAQSGRKNSEESKIKTRLSLLGKKLSDEHKLKISIALRGKIVSEDARQNMSLSQLGNKRIFSEQHKINIGLGNKGKIRSEEILAKMRLSSLGKKQSSETIIKRMNTIRTNKLLKLSA